MGAKARGWSKPDAELFDNVNPLRGDVFENALRGSAHIGVSLQDDVYHGQMKQGLIRLWPERGQASGQASTVHFFIFSNFRITLAWRGSDGVPQRRQQPDTGTARRAQMKAGGRSRNLHQSLLGHLHRGATGYINLFDDQNPSATTSASTWYKMQL